MTRHRKRRQWGSGEIHQTSNGWQVRWRENGRRRTRGGFATREASVVKRPHGRVRLVFDDLERSASDWRTLGFYTWKDMSQRVFRSLKLTDKLGPRR